MRLVLFAIGIGMGLQAWGVAPETGYVNADTGPAVTVLVGLLAFLVGRRRRPTGAEATAVAVASSEASAVASQTVQVALVVPGSAPASAGAQSWDSMPWIDATRPVTVLDGLDVSEVQSILEQDSEVVRDEGAQA